MTEILVLGVIISIIFYELTDITPGGIIVPGIMVVYFGQPYKLLYTVIVAILAFLIIKLLSRRFLIFGKRRFALLIVISLLLHIIVNLIFGAVMGTLTGSLLTLVGYTVSGITANNMCKQGVVKTVCSLAVVVGIIELIVILLSALGIAL